MKRRVTELSGYKPLLRWMAALAVIVGGALVMPAVALADTATAGNTFSGTNTQQGNSNGGDGNQGSGNQGDGNQGSGDSGHHHPSVPETPYAMLFPLAMVGLTVVAYRKRRSGTA